MSNVGGVTLLSPSSTTSTSSTSQTLTQQDFLKLMVAQFTQQDPLASGSDSGNGSGASQYVDQLMSMTNLTTMQTVAAQQGVQLAQELPGANVTVTNENGTTVTGTISKTTITSSGVNVTINGTDYSSSTVTSINQTAAQASAAAAAAASATANSADTTGSGTATTPATSTP